MEDMRFVVDLVGRINALQKDGKELHHHFMEGKYSLWSFEQYFLVSQIKAYSKSKKFPVYKKKRTPRRGVLGYIASFCFNIIVCVVTLIGVLSIFFRRIEVVTFSSDFLNADKRPTPRLRNIYNFFDAEHVSFIEILHVTSVSSFFKNLPKRSHPGVYFEGFSILANILTFIERRDARNRILQGVDLRSMSEDETKLVRLLLTEAADRIVSLRMTTILYSYFLKWTGADAFVAVDDFRYVPDIMLACERVDIPTHIFQHSNFGFLPGMYLLPSEMYIFPTKFYTWNKYWERRVKEVSAYFNHYADRIEIGGRSFSPLQPPLVERAEPTGEKTTIKVLIPYEVSLRSDYIAPYIEAMLKDERITILFVLRGTIDQIDPTMQVNQYVPEALRGNPRFVVMSPMDREKAIRACDVIAGVYSGFLDESVETGVPIAIFKTPFINVNRLDTDDLAGLIDLEKGDVFLQFVKAYEIPNATLADRRRRVTEGTKDITQTLRTICRDVKL